MVYPKEETELLCMTIGPLMALFLTVFAESEGYYQWHLLRFASKLINYELNESVQTNIKKLTLPLGSYFRIKRTDRLNNTKVSFSQSIQCYNTNQNNLR